MFKFICKSCKIIAYEKSSFTNSAIHKIHFLQLNQFSSSSGHSFTVNYLIESCSLSEKEAILASKLVNFESPDKPDSVLALFKKHGFTNDQISSVISKYPRVLSCKPEETLSPKIGFFQSLGFSNADISKWFSSRGNLLNRSLKTQIIPSFNALRKLFASHEDLALPIRRCPDILRRKFQSLMVVNIEILRNVGVPKPSILNLLKNQPRVFVTASHVLKEYVKELEKMGLNPKDKSFAKCLWRISSMNSLIWKRKMAVYERWGCSEDQVLVAFKKHSCTMAVSEGKIMDVMDFLVHKMGFNPCAILKSPTVLSLSLKKTIIPRCAVYQALLSKGLMNKNLSLSSFLLFPEKIFLERFVDCFENEAPELLKIYQENLKLSKISNDGGLQNQVKVRLT